MRNLVTITTPFRDQTVLQQHDGFALVALEGTVELEDERNYPVIRVVNERTVNFYADYNGTIIHALAQIENCTDGSCSLDDSLIRELVIRPA